MKTLLFDSYMLSLPMSEYWAKGGGGGLGWEGLLGDVCEIFNVTQQQHLCQA